MKKRGNILLLILFVLFVSCTAQQLQTIKKKVVSNTSKILGTIAQAYGGPYSELVQSFFKKAGSSEEQQGEYYAQGTYYRETKEYYSQDPHSREQAQPGTDYYPQTEGYAAAQEGGQPQGEYQSGQAGGQPPGDYYQGGYYQDAPTQQAQGSPPQGEYQTSQPGAQPAGGYYQETYQQQQLEVAIDLVREVNVGGRYEARPVMDGDTLTRKDNYKVTFQCNMPCYMYIAQLDSTGKLDPIFPSRFAMAGNPVTPYEHYTIPPGDDWFFLDENIGRETIYFIASRTRRPEIEDLFRKFEETNRDLTRLTPVSLDDSYIITRGIGGTRKGREQVVQFQNGSQGQYESTLISSIRADFVTTRWFEHR